MANYKYKAQDKEGKIISGVLVANSEIDLHEKLKADNIHLIEAKEVFQRSHNKRLKSNVVAEFSGNLGKLIGAGVTLIKALRITTEDESIKASERELYSRLLKNVKTGMSFSEALLEEGDAFPPLYINMMKSAEASGNLEQICMQMSDYYNKEYRLTGKVKSSMTYPKILGVLIVAVVAIIMGYVIPQFEGLFSQMTELPVATRILLAISNFMLNQWYILLFVVVMGTGFLKIFFSIPKVKYYRDKFILKAPVFGKLLKIIYTARFARTLSSMYSAGISIVDGIRIAQNTVGNMYIESQFDNMIAEISSGSELSESIDHIDGFTKKLSSAVRVGEETGALDQMLLSIADQMEYDSEQALARMVSYLEPAMIVVMAVIVGFIIISVIQPIYGSYESMANSVK